MKKLQRQRDLHRYRVERTQKTARDPTTIEKALNKRRDFERDWFRRYEDILHKVSCGPTWLSQSHIRNAVSDIIRDGDGRDYKLIAYCIMSNHVLIVLRPFVNESELKECTSSGGKPIFVSKLPTMPVIMQRIKGASARKANLLLGRSGSFWEHESFDRYVRDYEELIRIIRYTIRNPVKARLVRHWKEWKGTYLSPDFSETFL
ncbi:MAG TPA: hypothetical protein VMM38_04340 [Aridibacter sp.]|nr:hypothetical protein [Aridibacter sp.]